MIDRRRFATLAIAGCVWTSANRANNPTAPRVHRHHTQGPGSVNSWLIEAPGGLIVIDAQRRASDARALVERVTAFETPVAAVVITHAHPDHYGGLAVLASAWPDAQILGSADTAAILAQDRLGYTALALRLLGDDFPSPPTLTRRVADTEEIDLAGLPMRFRVVRRTEFDSITMILIPDHRVMFASDLVAHRMHPFLADADLNAWRLALIEMERTYADYRVHPGHGEDGRGAALFRGQRDYLDTILARVSAVRARLVGAPEDEIVEAAASAIIRAYPDWHDVTGRPDVHSINARAVLKALSAEGG